MGSNPGKDHDACVWSTMAEWSSASDPCSDGRVIRMWVRILASIMVLVYGVPWLSGLVHQTCVLMAELSECGFESWPGSWCLCMECHG